MKTRLLIVFAALLQAGCNNNTDKADAFGNFEATEILVSAETSGRIRQFAAAEGSGIDQGAEIALIDTTLFHLQKAEIDAAVQSVRTRISTITSQNEILTQQIENLKVNISRIEKMVKDDAATIKQYDDLTGQQAEIGRTHV